MSFRYCGRRFVSAYAAARFGRAAPLAVSLAVHRRATATVREGLASLRGSDVLLVDATDRLCDRAAGVCNLVLGGDLLYYDRHHLTRRGAQVALPERLLLPLLR